MQCSTVMCLLFLAASLSVVVDASSETNKTDESRRQSRNYDSYYKSSDEDSGSAEDGAFNPPKPARGDQPFPERKIYKGYSKFPAAGFGPYTPDAFGGSDFNINNKGYPFDLSQWKGITFPEATPEDMASLLNKYALINKKEEPSAAGYLSTLFSEPKHVLLAAAIPVTIILVAVLPVLMNKIMSQADGVVTTVASSKMARALQDPQVLEAAMQHIVEFAARSLEDECVLKAACEMALSKGGVENARTAAVMVARFGKDSWLQRLGAKRLVKALEGGSCKNVCKE